MQIRYTSELTNSNGIKALVFGGSGVGKTRLCATAPNPLILSAEDGLLSLRKSKVPYLDITDYKKLIEAMRWLLGSAEARKFDTYCLDSLSEIAEVVLAEEKKKTADPRKAYGAMQDLMYELIRTFRGIDNKQVVLVGKQMLVETAPNVKCAVPIMPSEKLQAQVPYFFDLVLHLYVGNDPATGNRYEAIHTQANTLWQAKDRSGTLDAIEYPNLTNIFKKAAA